MNGENTRRVTRAAHAKINLTLDVTGRRDDGYHLVKMVMQSVGLHDDVTVAVSDGGQALRGVTLACGGSGVPEDERNLAWRAAALFYQTTGIAGGCAIRIEKRIPVAAGLAGGSTDAAAVLHALNGLHGAGLTLEQLCEMGLRLGADVPYCLRGGTMLAEGIGEALCPLPAMPHAWVVLCRPPFEVSTAQAYRQLDSAVLLRRPDTDGMLRALRRGSLADMAGLMCNVMERQTAALHPEIGQIRSALCENGALGALMSGSGPTVFGLFDGKAQAERAAEALSRRFADTFVTETV